MSNIKDVPVEICCSVCQNLLLLGHMDIELTGEIQRSWFIVEEINITCPDCKGIITTATDDFTRVLDGIAPTND